MDGDTIARVVYLVLLGAAVIGWFIASNRESMGKTMQQAAVWGLIFLGTIAAVGLWQDIRRTTLDLPEISDGRVEIPRSADSHFYVTLDINNTPVRFVVDTGATSVVLSRDDARAVGIDLSGLRFTGQANTANGTVATAMVRLDKVELGPIRDRHLRAYVTDGEMDGSLLGMDYLNRFSELTIRADRMVLQR